MRRVLSIFFMVFVLLMVFSCNTKKNIQYFKNIEDVAIKESIRANTSTIQPGDMLGIVVLAKDNEVAKPFNQNYYSTNQPKKTQKKYSTYRAEALLKLMQRMPMRV